MKEPLKDFLLVASVGAAFTLTLIPFSIRNQEWMDCAACAPSVEGILRVCRDTNG